MSGYHQQPIVQPHHQQALGYLPAQFPPFFQGFHPSVLQQSNIQNIDLASAIQRLLLRYIISSVNNQSKPTIVMYQVLSTNEFQNQEFLNVVVMAMKAAIKLLQGGEHQERAIHDSFMNAAGRWVVNYLRANGQYWGLDQNDVNILSRIDSNVQQFENRVKSAGQRMTYPGVQQSHGYHIAAHAPQVTHVDLHATINAMHRSGPSVLSPVNSVPLNNGVLLSTLDIEDEPSHKVIDGNHTHQGQVSGVPSIDPASFTEHKPKSAPSPLENDSFVHPTVHIDDEDPEPVKETEKLPEPTIIQLEPEEETEDKNMLVHNGQFPLVLDITQEPNMNYEEHDLKRLIRSFAPGFDQGFEGIAAIDDLASAEIDYDKPRAAYGNEASENPDIGTDKMKKVEFRRDSFNAISDDDLRVSMAQKLSASVNTVIGTFSYPEVAVEEDYKDYLTNIFNHCETHSDIAETIGTVLSSQDLGHRELAKVIDRRMCAIVVEKMNLELSLPGSMDSYHDTISDVLQYLKDQVNEISYLHIFEDAKSMLAKALSGLDYGLLEDIAVVCLTRCSANQFPYVIGDRPDMKSTINMNDRVATINPLITPALHAGISKIFEYVSAITETALVRKVYLMTFDGAKISLYKSPFTDCFIALKETE